VAEGEDGQETADHGQEQTGVDRVKMGPGQGEAGVDRRDSADERAGLALGQEGGRAESEANQKKCGGAP